VQVLFDRLKYGVRVEFDILHDGGEHVPFDLGKRKEEVLVGEERMLPPARLLDRPIDNALRSFSNLAWRDVEIVYVHVLPPSAGLLSKMHASKNPLCTPVQRRYKPLSAKQLSCNGQSS
jgi:hypothetical protein